MTVILEIAPISGALGAEISGVNLSEPLSNVQFGQIRRAFLDHHVIFFRDQKNLTPNQQKDFARRFGSLNVHPYVKGMADHPELMEIIKEPEETANFGGDWHSDMSFLELPALGSVLYGIEIPPFGGDTLFANQIAAYQALSEGMQKMLDGLTAIHTASREYGAKGISAQARTSMQAKQAADAPEFEHPVVRTQWFAPTQKPENADFTLTLRLPFASRV